MTSRSSRHVHSPSASSHTTESPPLSNHTPGEIETVLVAKKFSSVSLAEREERQQALDRMEILKTVIKKIKIIFPIPNEIIEMHNNKKKNTKELKGLFIHSF
jgi:hypothetical protein